MAPTLRDLHFIKWKDTEGQTKKFRLSNTVSRKWKAFGTLLDLEPNELDGIQKKHMGETSECWMDVMQRWLNGCSSDYPVTWQGLIELIDDTGYSQVSADLKAALEQRELHKGNLMYAYMSKVRMHSLNNSQP